MMTLYRLNSGSTMISRNNIPSVKYFILVLSGFDKSSNRIEYPTSSPRTVPTSSATLVATEVAATLLGCVHATTRLLFVHPASCRYCGISAVNIRCLKSAGHLRVDLPHPVWPTTMTHWYFSIHHNSLFLCL